MGKGKNGKNKKIITNEIHRRTREKTRDVTTELHLESTIGLNTF